MKMLSALVLICAAATASAKSADVAVSVSLGEPGYYGELNMGNMGRPPVIYSQPVIIEHRYHNMAPIYLRVPPGQAKNWRHYCDRYNACTRPVYFVRDDWYRNVYAPHYRDSYGHNDHDHDHDHDGDHGYGHDAHDRNDHDQDHHDNGYGNGR